MTKLRPQLPDTRASHSLPLFLAALFIAFALSLASRVVQLREWQGSPETFSSRGVPVAGADSYFFFRYAQDYQAGVDHSGRDPLRHFPDGSEYLPFSALAASMVTVSRWTGLDLYEAGHWIVIVSSSLFVFPLGLYCFRLGLPLVGIWGALVGSFGLTYYQRTTVYRVDTDGGNLFFLWMVSLLVLGIDMGAGRVRAVVMAAAAGLCLNAFCIWYGQPGFVVLFGGCVFVTLAARRTSPRMLLMLLAVFLICANPLNLIQSASDISEFTLRYLLGEGSDPAGQVGALHFPNVLSEIAELRWTPFPESLGSAAGNTAVGVLGLAGFGWLAWRRPIEMLPLLPLGVLAILGIVRAERFLMYTGPFLGMGCGWLMTLGLRAVAARAPDLGATVAARAELLAGLVGVVPLAFLLPMTTFLGVEQLRFPVEFVASLQRMGDELPEPAAIAHTWGDGYLVTAITGAATFNDGQDPDPVIEQLLDRALTDADPATLHDVVSFIARHGRGGIDATILQEQSYSGLLAQMEGSEPPESPPVYVLLSNRMIRGFGAIWEKGRWNFETNSGVREGYDVRSCETEAGVLRCRKKNKRDILVDVERGTVNGRRALAHFVRIVDGRIAEERDYQDPLGMSMQLIETEDDEAATLHILKSPVFRSNFNQMFLLGRFDPRRFRLVSDEFPVARLYEVLPTSR